MFPLFLIAYDLVWVIVVMVMLLLGLPAVAFLSLFLRHIRKCLRGLAMVMWSTCTRWSTAWQNSIWTQRGPVSCFTAETEVVLLRWYGDRIKHLVHNTSPMLFPIWEAELEGALEAASLMKKIKRTQWQSAVCSLSGKGSPAIPRRDVSNKMLLQYASPVKDAVLCSLLWIQRVKSIPYIHAWLIKTLS